MTINNLDLREDEETTIIINADRDLNYSLYAYWISGDTPSTRAEVGFDFTPYTGATLHVKESFSSKNVILKFDTDDNSIQLPVSGSTFLLVKSFNELQKVRGGKYKFDMYLRKKNEASKRAFLRGTFIIKNIITL